MDTKTQNIFNVINNNENLVNSIMSAYSSALSETGDASYTRFMNAVKQVANTHLKPTVSTSRASSGGSNGWKDNIKAEFSGRGRQWFYVPIEAVSEALNNFDNNGDNTENYRNDIQNEGKAWVRFVAISGSEDQPHLRVEVRINGSREDHPQNRINIPMPDPVERLEDGKTPYALGLEANSKRPERKTKSDNATQQNNENTDDNNEMSSVSEIDELSALINEAQEELTQQVAINTAESNSVNLDNNTDDDWDSDMHDDDIDSILG